MRVAKIKTQKKNKKEVIDNNYSIRNMLSIILVVLITFILFYFITYFVVKNDNAGMADKQTVEIDETKITFNNILNRNESEYYVLAYKSNIENKDTNFKALYDSYINTYKQKQEALTFYYVDLDDAFNKSHISDKLNISDNIEEVSVSDEVLFKIKDGKIEKSYEGKDSILDKLSRL